MQFILCILFLSLATTWRVFKMAMPLYFLIAIVFTFMAITNFMTISGVIGAMFTYVLIPNIVFWGVAHVVASQSLRVNKFLHYLDTRYESRHWRRTE